MATLLSESGCKMRTDGWFKSSYSGTSGCVEVNFDADVAVWVRDSNDGRAAAAAMRFDPAIWDRFIQSIKSGAISFS